MNLAHKDCTRRSTNLTRVQTLTRNVKVHLGPMHARRLQDPSTGGSSCERCMKGAPVDVQGGAVGTGGAALGDDDCAHEARIRVSRFVTVRVVPALTGKRHITLRSAVVRRNHTLPRSVLSQLACDLRTCVLDTLTGNYAHTHGIRPAEPLRSDVGRSDGCLGLQLDTGWSISHPDFGRCLVSAGAGALRDPVHVGVRAVGQNVVVLLEVTFAHHFPAVLTGRVVMCFSDLHQCERSSPANSHAGPITTTKCSPAGSPDVIASIGYMTWHNA